MELAPVKRIKRAKKSKRPDKRPARSKYWMSRKLEQKKIRNLMECCGMTKQQAYHTWHHGLPLKNKLDVNGNQILWGKRKGRVPANYLKVG